MNGFEMYGGSESRRNRHGYQQPRLERLGTLRELTQCGSYPLLDLLLGGDIDGCALTGSSFHTWSR
jgi:hypothetical protein